MDIKKEICDYLLEKYNPRALVIHGSRANGFAREHSDWDILIFTDTKVMARREIYKGQNIDIAQIVLPLEDEKIESTLGFFYRAENTEIVYDPSGIAKDIMTKNEEVLKKGNLFSAEDREPRYAFMQSALSGVKDYADNQLICFSKKSEFFERAILSWFKFLHTAFRPSNYIGLPYIEKEDPVFMGLLKTFIESDPVKAYTIGHTILAHIFPDLHAKYDDGELPVQA